jgi:hypothetical protein
MRALMILLSLLLLAACPKTTTTSSGAADPSPTPSRSTDHLDRSQVPRSTTSGPSAESAQRIVHAILVAEAGSHAPIPENLVVEQEDDRVLHVRGNPRALPTRGGVWITAAALGDESAANKVVDMKALMAALRTGTEPLHGGVRIVGDAPENAQAMLTELGVTVVSATEAGLEVNVPASKLDALLGTVWVAAFEVAP